MPTEDWFCRKLAQLNLTLVEGYPSCGSERCVPETSKVTVQVAVFCHHKGDPSAISSWSTDASKLNNSYSRIARHSGLSSTLPASRRISQETLQRWEKSAREASVMCNQAASFSRCLFRVQQNMQDQLKPLRSKSKAPARRPQLLMNFRF